MTLMKNFMKIMTIMMMTTTPISQTIIMDHLEDIEADTIDLISILG